MFEIINLNEVNYSLISFVNTFIFSYNLEKFSFSTIYV